MSEMSLAQLIEEKFRAQIKIKYSEISSFSFPQQWIIEIIESILEEFPVLKAINYQELGVNGLLSLVKTLIHDVEVFTDESETVLIIEAQPSKSFLTMKEFIIMFLLSALTDISLFHFIFTRKKLETIDCKDFEVFPYIVNSSVVLINTEKHQYNLITSLKSLVNYIFTSPDNFTKKMTSTAEFLKQYGDSSIADYIDKSKAELNIDDLALKIYLCKNPIVIHTEKSSINNFIKKNKL